MDLSLDTWKHWYSSHKAKTLEDYFQFLKFQSIGTDAHFDDETKACAHWVSDYLKAIGLDVSLWETSGQPVVFAQKCDAGKDRPTLLIYHHYDVQPVDPIELWNSPPFEPEIRNGNVYARGAQDNKGQCLYSLTALKALFELASDINFNLKVFVEGEEESGSAGTKEAIEAHANELKCDSMLVIDSGIPAPGVGAITLGIRGILTMDVTVRSADGDMHSGALGGAAYNPIRALTHALDRCFDETGKIAIPHFYEGVEELSATEKEKYNLNIDEQTVIKEFGLRALCPEPGFSIGESVSIRPTFEINGIKGGYTGEGFKTVLPAVASAKISCRLVPNQDPDIINANIKKHLQKHLPEGLELHIENDHGIGAFRSSDESPIAKLAQEAYEEVLETPCQKILSGGSIPIVTDLARASGSDVVLMGYLLDTDQMHAPNEHFGLDRIEQGFLTVGRILSLLNES